jgi:proline iminopeptidase
MNRGWRLIPTLLAVTCAAPPASNDRSGVGSMAGSTTAAVASYFDNTGRDDLLTGGARMIPIATPKGEFRVWTKRVGNNPKLKVLLLHGGPGATHEYFEAFDTFLPAAGVEYYYYDQLGSAYSDQPDEPSLWEIPRFVDEVEQVRKALGLSRDNFVLLGQSWGGILAIEYALAHGDALKGLVISNMMASIPAYNRYAREVLMPKMDPAVLAEILAFEAKKEFLNPRYEELLFGSFYVEHILRMELPSWPPGVLRAFGSLNKKVYIPMQGPSEMGASGKLELWDRTADLGRIAVPTLVIGAAHDTMDPEHMKWMAGQFPKGRHLHCPNGSHLAMYDDQATYMSGLVAFLGDLESGKV